MKLLTVNMTLDPVTGGGSAARALQVTRALADAGVVCALAADGAGLSRLPAAMLGGITRLEMPVVGGRFRIPVAGFSRLRAAAAAHDVMMLVNHWTMINVAAFRAAIASATPYVVCPAGALPVGGRSRAFKHTYNTLWGQRIIREAAGHIAVTDDERAEFAPYGIRPEQIAVIPNGLPTVSTEANPAGFRGRHGIGPAPFFLFVGRLAPIKGPDLLLAAFLACAARLPEWHLVLAGPDDGMRVELERQAAASGLLRNRIHFAGFLDDAGKADALAAADLVVVPSRREAMSIVVLEAAAAGRPALVTDRCGIPEVATSGGGWVVPPSVDGLSDGLIAAALASGRLREMGARWRAFAADRYGWPRIARLHIDLFAAVTSGRRPR